MDLLSHGQQIWACTVLSCLLASCAGPQLQVAKAPADRVLVEREKQSAIGGWKGLPRHDVSSDPLLRLYHVYSRLRTIGAGAMCGEETKPFWGMIFPDEKEDLLIWAIGPAAAAGFRDGDVIRIIDGYLVEHPRLMWSSRSFRPDVLKILGKAEMKPVEIEVKRPGGNYRAAITPELACRFSVRLTQNGARNAHTDGEMIFMNTGMMNFAGSDDELALVLGHELAHILLGHVSRKKLNRAVGGLIGTLFDVGLAAGARIDSGGLGARTGAQTGALAYSKEFEREADYMALYFLARAGFDISQAPEFWRRIASQDPVVVNQDYSRTHPSSLERAANLAEAISEIESKRAAGRPLLPTALKPDTDASAESAAEPGS